MKRKNAIKREQSQARLSYVEREHFGAKLKYEKPSMKVYPLQKHSMILCSSNRGVPGYDYDFSYAPGAGIGDETNNLA